MEEQRDERERQRRDGSAGEDIGHALADRRLCLIGKVAEYRQQDECGEVIAGHNYADQPLNVEDLRGIACLELRRGDAVHSSCEDVRQEGRAPGVVHLPEQQDAEKGEANQECSPVIELQRGFANSIVHNTPQTNFLSCARLLIRTRA